MISVNRHAATRYAHGALGAHHKGKPITTSVGSKMDIIVSDIQNLPSKVGIIPAEYAHRPDLISNIFYGTPGYWWYLMQVNGISDPFEGFNSGDQILIPVIS